MRVLFAVAGGPSHLYPLIPLARALRQAGHQVCLAGPPRATETMRDTGLSTVSVGTGPRLSAQARADLVDTAYGQPPWPADWPAHPDTLTPAQARLLEVLGRYTVAAAEAVADGLVEFARRWRPDLIIHDTLALSAAIAATVVGVPHLRYTHGTQDAFLVEYRLDGRPLPGLAGLFERFGLEPPPRPGNYLDTVPPSMFIGAERPAIAMRYVPYNGPGAAPGGLTGRRRPRVCLTWGLVVPGALGPAATDPYRAAIAAITRTGVEVLALVSPERLAALGTAPPGARYLAGTPLRLVLPHCDAIVHHGGEGSAMTAACLAVPQLTITREPLDDQCGGRLAGTGAAIHLRHQHVRADPTRIARAVEQLLSEPGYTARARALRDDVDRQPAPSEVVATLAGRPGT
ncbi:nucleotide disphospho-sugar-binding domain-containing protein [Actinophytocola sp.]|uniref:nucleotide disphospho-sugar-binding domain-containing protein n=1 Tax=Actinophytocola sp. TaxID=1872138 RepID=UPI002D7F6000|nr:nucleotide disphospho-sugar-binding domain-containing protein [Actinophytocola sp.]HET9144267.1 nucleotide disphospho-sugar-binding domain-containing protein [Actinophytocola sp.]